jgi:hypothetical protein
VILAALLLQAAAPETAVEAEHAFRRAAQAEGQWTAFRRFATPDGIVFTPQPGKAQEVLPGTNPPIAVQWWPAQSYVSCDGTTAVNTGPWVRPKGVGYFTTVWHRQADGGWKWSLDYGDALAEPRALPEQARVRQASCRFQRSRNPHFRTMTNWSGPGKGKSPDGTLLWEWSVAQDGARTVTAWLWNGRGLDRVIHDMVAAR